MINEIRFEKAEGKLQASIDNQKKPLTVYKIIKEQTEFFINKNIYATLYTPIQISLLLTHFYENEEEEIEEEIEEIDTELVEQGVCYLTIKDLSTNNVIDKKVVNFYDGLIETEMTSDLYLGEYYLEAYYPGNKYYESSSITMQFSVTKREVKCILDDNDNFGYPNKQKNINVTVVDILNNKKISNCTINYSFNGIEYITQTNDNGRASLIFTIPSVDKNKCSLIQNESNELNIIENNDANIDFFLNDEYVTYNTETGERETNDIDESIYTENSVDPEYNATIIEYNEEENEAEDKENTYDRPEYELVINIDDGIYILNEELIIKIYSKIYDTEISFFTKLQDNNNTLHIEGDVIAFDEQKNTYNVDYGTIDFNITKMDPHPYCTLDVDENGHFSFDITLTDSPIGDKLPEEDDDLLMYSSKKETDITLTNLGESHVTRNYAEKHRVRFEAIVTYNDEIIPYGMVSFILMKNYKEIYRYVTEVNNNGEAFFSFDISTIGEYQVMAKYHKIFEYQESESNILKYTVE